MSRRRFQTAEVNFGAVAHIAEGARAQEAFADTVFPVSSWEAMSTMLASLDAYYSLACAVLGIQPTPLPARRLVLVENDGWYIRPVCIAEAFSRMGVAITVAPREALVYDPEANELLVRTSTGLEPVDQLFLDFGYGEDIEESESSAQESTWESEDASPRCPVENAMHGSAGAITRALMHRAVVAESAIVVQTILGAKTTQALIDQFLREPQSRLVTELDIDPADLRAIEGMAPATFQWEPTYFASRAVNGFEVRDYLARAGVVAKATAGGLYGGRGVYLFDGHDSAVQRRFWADVRRRVQQTLASFQTRVGSAAMRRFLLRALVGSAVEADLVAHLGMAREDGTRSRSTTGRAGKHRRLLATLFDVLRRQCSWDTGTGGATDVGVAQLRGDADFSVAELRPPRGYAACAAWACLRRSSPAACWRSRTLMD